MSATANPGRSPHWRTRSAAVLLLGGASIVIWWPLLGGGVLWGAPMLLWALLITTGVVRARSRSASVAISSSWIVWLPLALLLSGAPQSALDPLLARETVQQLIDGARGVAAGAPGPWGLASWLVFAGTCWARGAANAIRSGQVAAAWAFLSFAAPFVAALAAGRAEDAAWHGAVLLAATLLWATAGTLRAALPAVVVVAITAATLATAFGPTERRLRVHGERASTGTVDWNLSYGPDTTPRTGATLLEIRSGAPALWRARVLDHFNGRSFEPAVREPSRDLPQPAATLATATVSIRKLADVQAVGAGRIVAIAGGPPARRASSGETMQFATPPERGTQYTATAQVVRATAAQLATVPVPDPGRFVDQVALWDDLGTQMGVPLARHVSRLPQALIGTPFDTVIRAAHTLARGTRSQLVLVRRVRDYLVGSGEFGYSRTDAPPAGLQPLLSFLTDSRVGYCQHFAGAAALLLRLMGVPARVAVGFATGKPIGPELYRVTDADAHAWVEVYFDGFGWVAVDPTPAAAGRSVGDDGLLGDRRPVPASVHGRPQAAGLALLATLAGALVVALLRRLWRGRRRSPLLSELLVRVAWRDAAGPGCTVASVAPQLAKIGPTVAALAELAQRERFAPDGCAVRHPRWEVWCALRCDAGLWRATALMLRTREPVPRSVQSSGHAASPDLSAG
ncbi:MAG: transglutaminase-like domain-containing protein [Patulibacter sp.]